MSELKEAIELLEKEKGISRESLLESIEQSLMQACKSNFGKNDNSNGKIDPVTCEYSVTAEKEV
ncbi:MAG: transcription termination/antitermination protein NusA, partial [Lachnospiraceae bacterium]|nr:transcription termination/antitermination protein NusA [Lachnospiraceae bacterium]